jgi:hypothetical protein
MGGGELLGFGLRAVSGALADVTRRFWPITITGYLVQMAAVPALALTQEWRTAACLVVLERIGKAIRNPPRDVMLANAAQHVGGYGWVFGIHEAFDQFGAMVGPLVVAAVLAHHGDYPRAFAVLAIPAVFNLIFVAAARVMFPTPDETKRTTPLEHAKGRETLPQAYWLYVLGAGLVAAGFADYPLIAFHWVRHGTLTTNWIPIFYAVAMAVSGGASLALGRLFDRFGFNVLIALTIICSISAPLVFLVDHFAAALLGVGLWGREWASTSRLFLPPSHRWFRRTGGRQPSGRLRPSTGSVGLSGAPRSVGCMTVRSWRRSHVPSGFSLPRCPFSFWYASAVSRCAQTKLGIPARSDFCCSCWHDVVWVSTGLYARSAVVKTAKQRYTVVTDGDGILPNRPLGLMMPTGLEAGAVGSSISSLCSTMRSSATALLSSVFYQP